LPSVFYPASTTVHSPEVDSGVRADAVATPVETATGPRILVTGGRLTYLTSLYESNQWFLWNPDQGTVEDQGELTYGRSSHLALPVGSGKVLLVGGFVISSPQTFGYLQYEIFNVDNHKVTLGTHSIEILGNFLDYGTSTLDGKAVICAGALITGTFPNLTLTPKDQCVQLDAQDRLTELAPLPVALAAASIAPLPDGDLLVTGGIVDPVVTIGLVAAQKTAYRWDHQKDQWREVSGTLRYARAQHQSVLLRDGRVLLIGGVDQVGNLYASSGEAVRCTETFDPDTETFTETDCTDAGAGQEASVSAAGDYVFALEGYTSPSIALVDGGDTIGALRMIPDLPE
jgi:hypothetical protein